MEESFYRGCRKEMIKLVIEVILFNKNVIMITFDV